MVELWTLKLLNTFAKALAQRDALVRYASLPVTLANAWQAPHGMVKPVAKNLDALNNNLR